MNLPVLRMEGTCRALGMQAWAASTFWRTQPQKKDKGACAQHKSNLSTSAWFSSVDRDRGGLGRRKAATGPTACKGGRDRECEDERDHSNT